MVAFYFQQISPRFTDHVKLSDPVRMFVELKDYPRGGSQRLAVMGASLGKLSVTLDHRDS
jgi:hypothetical protein